MKANFETGLKVCSSCKKELPIENYNKCKTTNDGLCYKCRDCEKIFRQSEKGKEIGRKVHQKYGKTEEGKETAKRARQKYYKTEKGKECQKRDTIRRSCSEEWKEKAKERSKRYYQEHKPELKRVERTIIINKEGNFLFCTNCKRILPLSMFHKDNHQRIGYDTWCKDCRREFQRRRMSTEENKERAVEWQKNFRKTEKGSIYVKQYVNRKYKEDSNHRIAVLLRSRILKALKGTAKSAHSEELLGCSWEELKQHLENQFVDGMNWDNQGKDGWEIDHIIPCSYFDLSIEENQRICFNFRNLQPLWAEDNKKKRDALPENYEELLQSIKQSLNIQ